MPRLCVATSVYRTSLVSRISFKGCVLMADGRFPDDVHGEELVLRALDDRWVMWL